VPSLGYLSIGAVQPGATGTSKSGLSIGAVQPSLTTTGSLTATLGSLTLTGSGTSTPPVTTGSLTATLGSITLTGSGTSSPPATVGNLTATLGSLTLTASGTSLKPNRWLFASESSGWSVSESTSSIASVTEGQYRDRFGVDPDNTTEGGY